MPTGSSSDLALTPENLRQIVDDYHADPSEQRTEVLLYEPKPLYIVRQEHDRHGGIIMRDYIHAAMWSIPNEHRGEKSFLQKARLADLRHMLHYMYDTDFSDLNGSEFADDIQRWKNEPLLRPCIPSMLNPQFAAALLNYMLKQMQRLGTKRLIIYEVYGHNGQTALALLDLLQEEYPELYATCEYHMVDTLGVWMTHRDAEIKAHHYDHYFEHHVSFFDWDVLVEDRVFFLCLECLSYLPLDRVEAHSFDGGTRWQYWETWMRECADWDKRYHASPQGYEMFKSVSAARLLQDELILEYLKHIDYEGTFARERLEQHLKDNVEAERGLDRMREGRNSFGTTYAESALQHSRTGLAGLLSGYSKKERTRIAFRGLDNVFWVPTMQVPFFDKLRTYFPRHTLVVLDHAGRESTVQGRDAPSVRQYAFGTHFDVNHMHFHHRSFGRTEIRANLNFDHLRKLYYQMMELPVNHPLHLRGLTLQSFFEVYGTKTMVEQMTVKDVGAGILQPLDCFPGARVLVTEFGAETVDVADVPADAMAKQFSMRHRFYQTVWNFFVRTGLAAEESLYRIAPREDEGGIAPDQRQRLPHLHEVRARIGQNPGPAQLDAPIGYRPSRLLDGNAEGDTPALGSSDKQ